MLSDHMSKLFEFIVRSKWRKAAIVCYCFWNMQYDLIGNVCQHFFQRRKGLSFRNEKKTNPHFFTYFRVDLSKSSECFALSHNKFGKMITLPLAESDMECFPDLRCFTNGRSDQSSNDLHCDGDGKP